MACEGLPRGRRLHLQNDFKRVIYGGTRIQGHGLVLWYKPAPAGQQDRRLGIVISKKLGPAVLRNRIKRLLREAFRLNRERLKSATDYVFSPRDGQTLSAPGAAQQAVLALCAQAGLTEPGQAPAFRP